MNSDKVIHLYTEKYHLEAKLKAFAKLIIGKYWRGPQAVEDSLKRGLKAIGVPYDINRPPQGFDTVGVLSGVKVLAQVIEWKKQGKIKKIIAGPNLVVGPYDANSIVLDPLIDVFLVPCNWSGDFYVSLEPELKSKIRIWPAGVELPALDTQEKKYDFLIYNKIGGNNLVGLIIEELTKQSLSYTCLNYGYFKQKDYFKALSESKSLIYLSGSESQGLALFEAWARGVPSLVWERGYWKYKNYEWNNSKSGPYVTEENGMTFRDLAEFQTNLPIFLSKEFKARKFIEDEFTLEKAADKYLTIYKSLI